jgi:hypothetical protein
MRELELAFGIGIIVNASGFEHSGGGFYIEEENVVVWCQMYWSTRVDLGCAMSAHRSFSNHNEAREH